MGDRALATVVILKHWGPAGTHTPPRLSQAEVSLTADCYRETYEPDEVTRDGRPFGHFGAKQICTIPQEQQVCIRAQEYYNDAWRNISELECEWTPGAFQRAANRTWPCRDLGPGRYRTRARYTHETAGGTIVWESSSAHRLCD